MPDARALHGVQPTLHEAGHVQAAAERGRGDSGSNPLRREKALIHWLHKLDRLLDRGSEVERRIWDSAIESCVILPENIPESYWKQQTRIARDNGRGDVQIGEEQKKHLISQIQDAQRTGLKSWATYLEHTGQQYPLWFKLYAWDGMSRLGVFNRSKRQFSKRDEATVAPYPQLNPSVLAKVYDHVKSYFADGAEPEDHMAELVKNGNFNRLYSHILLETKAILPTPEKPEDIRGTWKTYTSSDIDALTAAAEGTEWCIAGKSSAESYTDDGRGEFHLFHLFDPTTGSESPTACASVRMSNGRVAEISGLKGGSDQYLEDALVPEVAAKVSKLPGGERYLEAFADKQTLIAMDRKFQAGESFTLEELEFLYEVDRKICYLDTYQNDPRPGQFKKKAEADKHRETLAAKYGDVIAQFLVEVTDAEDDFESWLERGIPIKAIIGRMSSEYIDGNLTQLLEHGADAKQLVGQLTPRTIANNLTQLLEHGASIDVKQLVGRLGPRTIANNLTELLEHGATIDVNQLVGQLTPRTAPDNLTELLEHGADVNQLVGRLGPRTIADNLTELLEHGATIDVNKLVGQLAPWTIADNLTELLEHGATIDVNQLVGQLLESWMVDDNLTQLLEHGADANQLVGRLTPRTIANNLTLLLKHGADINAKQLVGRLTPRTAADNLTWLLEHSADANQLVSQLEPWAVANNLTELLEHGATIDVNQLVGKLESWAVANSLTQLLEHGADVNELVSRLAPWMVASNLTELLEHGATIDVNQLVGQLERNYLADNIHLLFTNGASVDIIMQKLAPWQVVENIAILKNCGANISVDDLLNKLGVYNIRRLLATLLENGADVSKVIKKLGRQGVQENSSMLMRYGATREMINENLYQYAA